MKIRGLIVLTLTFCACDVPRFVSPPSQPPAAAQTLAAPQTQAAASDQQAAMEQRIIQTALDLKSRSQVNYKIQPGDLLEITIFKEADMSRTARVSGNGTITFPLAGNVKLSEISVPEAEELLATNLAEFLVKPQVTVLIKEYGNKQIYVLGEVKKPGSIQLPAERRLTVLEAITLAGGFTDLASPDRTKVLRGATGQNQTIQVEISRITKQGDKSADIFLEPNDTVFVPQSFF